MFHNACQGANNLKTDKKKKAKIQVKVLKDN